MITINSKASLNPRKKDERDKYRLKEKLWCKKKKITSDETKVRVIRKAENNEKGWNNSWNSDGMDSYVGTVCTISSGSTKGKGIKLKPKDKDEDGFYYSFPYFVLEIVE